MKRAPLLTLVPLLAIAFSAPSCSTTPGVWPNCTTSQWEYDCEFQKSKGGGSCGCSIGTEWDSLVMCASSEAGAIEQVNAYIARRGESLVVGVPIECIRGDRGTFVVHSIKHVAVKIVEADPGCVECAESACPDDYASCQADTNCSCLVSCLANGGGTAECVSTCGTPSAVATSTASCLGQFCANACAAGPTSSTGSGSTCTCDDTSASAGSTSGGTGGSPFGGAGGFGE